MFRRLHRRLAPAAWRCVPLLALAGFLAGTIGVPLPRLAMRGKDRSQPYPCMDHACGCASAEQCWHSCCCFTNREKVAWANQRGVALPDYVVAAAKREQPRAASCCRAHGDCHAHEEAHAAAELTIEFLLAIQARKCQGQAELWLAAGAASLPPARVDLSHVATDCGPAAAILPPLLGISTSPDSPPPRA